MLFYLPFWHSSVPKAPGRSYAATSDAHVVPTVAQFIIIIIINN